MAQQASRVASVIRGRSDKMAAPSASAAMRRRMRCSAACPVVSLRRRWRVRRGEAACAREGRTRAQPQGPLARATTARRLRRRQPLLRAARHSSGCGRRTAASRGSAPAEAWRARRGGRRACHRRGRRHVMPRRRRSAAQRARRLRRRADAPRRRGGRLASGPKWREARTAWERKSTSMYPRGWSGVRRRAQLYTRACWEGRRATDTYVVRPLATRLTLFRGRAGPPPRARPGPSRAREAPQ